MVPKVKKKKKRIREIIINEYNLNKILTYAKRLFDDDEKAIDVK